MQFVAPKVGYKPDPRFTALLAKINAAQQEILNLNKATSKTTQKQGSGAPALPKGAKKK